MSPKLEIALIVIMLTGGWSEGGLSIHLAVLRIAGMCRRRPRLFLERFNSPTAVRISWGRSIFRKMAIIYPP